MTQLTRPDLHAEIDGRFPDNTQELITPAIVRAFLHNLVDSARLAASDKLSVDLTLPQAQALLATAAGSVAAGQYYAATGNWNATGASSTVYVRGLNSSAYEPEGVLLAAGKYSLVSVDVAAGTAVAARADTYTKQQSDARQAALLVQLAAVAATLPLTAVRSADYTLALTDAGCLVPVSAAGAVAITLPGQADVALAIGTTGYVRRQGQGAVTLVPGANVQFLPAGVGTSLTPAGECSFHKIDLNTYWLKGDLL